MKIINKHLNIFLCIMLIGILINANSHFNHIRGFFNSEITLFSLINLIRASSIVITIFLIVILNLKKIKIKQNLLISIFYLYIFIQLVSFLFTRKLNLEYDQFYFLLNQFLIIFFFHITISLKEISNDKLFFINKIFFYTLIVFIFSAILILGKNLYLEYLSTGPTSFYYGYFVSPGSIYLNQQVPRITGIARLILVLVIFFSITLLYSKLKTSSFIILSFLISMLFLTDSRFSIYSFFILSFILIILDKKFFLLKKILFFIFIIFFSNLINISMNALQKNFGDTFNTYQKDLNISNNDTQNEKKQLWGDVRKKEDVALPPRILRDFSTSGRLKDWSDIIVFIKKKPIIGYGFQADRYLINRPASNAYLYSLVSGGVIGFILFAGIVTLSISSCFRVIFFNKIFQKKSHIIVKSSILINIMLIIRTIIENSFSIYNFDLIIFLLTYLIINYYEKNPQKYSY